MALPLLLLGLGAVSGVGTGMYVFRAGSEDKDLKPKIAGVPAVPALAVGGGLLALMGGSLLTPIGIGLLIGSLVGGYGLHTVKQGLDGVIEAKIKAQLGDPNNPGPPAPPALPGPGASSATEPGGAPGGGLLNWLFPGGGGDPAAAGA